jgi:hypothetical protein
LKLCIAGVVLLSIIGLISLESTEQVDQKKLPTFIFEQVAVATNDLTAPVYGSARGYQVMVAYVMHNNLSKPRDAVVTCSLFANGKLVGSTIGFQLNLQPSTTINGSAGPTIEKIEPDSAQCSVQVLS